MEKPTNLFPSHFLMRASKNKFDFLSIDPEYFEKQFCINCKKINSVHGDILYENADNYLSEFLDIETLFINYQEVDMLKKIWFDYDQRKLFEFLARLSNLPKIFSLIDINERIDLFENDNGSEIFSVLQRMFERKRENDVKLIKFTEKIFKK